jgi:excisionase family DNA binding protein
MKNKYMTPKEVAMELEVSSATIVRWVRDGTIAAKRFGPRIIKIPRIEVDRLVSRDQAVTIK